MLLCCPLLEASQALATDCLCTALQVTVKAAPTLLASCPSPGRGGAAAGTSRGRGGGRGGAPAPAVVAATAVAAALGATAAAAASHLSNQRVATGERLHLNFLTLLEHVERHDGHLLACQERRFVVAYRVCGGEGWLPALAVQICPAAAVVGQMPGAGGGFAAPPALLRPAAWAEPTHFGAPPHPHCQRRRCRHLRSAYFCGCSSARAPGSD